jgi:hypothetical protein
MGGEIRLARILEGIGEGVAFHGLQGVAGAWPPVAVVHNERTAALPH